MTSIRSVRLKATPRLTPIVVALVSVVCVSACGSSSQRRLNIAQVERAVATSILKERGLHTTVACPSKVPQEAGHVFTCMAHPGVGAYPVTVTETNGSGYVRYENRAPLIVLNVVTVQRAITTSILKQRRLRSTVTCPSEVLQQAGVVFTCTATINGKGSQYPFIVSEIDGKGHVRYVGTGRRRPQPLPPGHA
jgi:Domain of unknown function (DUF4333)